MTLKSQVKRFIRKIIVSIPFKILDTVLLYAMKINRTLTFIQENEIRTLNIPFTYVTCRGTTKVIISLLES